MTHLAPMSPSAGAVSSTSPLSAGRVSADAGDGGHS
jgi:hypothetical protein